MAGTPRAAQGRAASLRPSIGGESLGVLHIDTSALDKDFEVQWQTESVLGADLRENIRLNMTTRQFQPVMASELPSEASALYPGEQRGEHDVIRRGGLVLMKRPRSLALEERADLRRENAEALRSVNREFEEGVQSREGMERLPDGGVKASIERRGRAGAFADA